MYPRSPAPISSLALLCLVACGRDPDSPEQSAPLTCPPTESARLADQPADFGPADFFHLYFEVLGDKLLYSIFNHHDDADDVYWLVDLCTGSREEVSTLNAEVWPDTAIDTAEGKLLFGYDIRSDDEYIIDRLDVPGIDEPRRVPGLPAGLREGYPSAGGILFGDWKLFVFGHSLGAAGIGAKHRTMWFFGGDPDVPAVSLGDAIVDGWEGDGELLLLDDDGVLRSFDPATSSASTYLTGVRGAFISDDGRWLIWQERGDDVAESVYVRDRETGQDTFLVTNPWAAESWGRGSDWRGRWELLTAEHPVAALIGPDSMYAAVFRLDTGESIAVPAHRRVSVNVGSYFGLQLVDADEVVLAFWDPLSDEPPRIWRRGSVSSPFFDYQPDENAFTYAVETTGELNVFGLRRFDLDTWEDSEFAPHLSAPIEALDDGRYLTSFRSFDPQIGHEYGDLLVFDPATQVFTTVAESVAAYRTIPGGVVYLDIHVPDRGIHVTPLPAP